MTIGRREMDKIELLGGACFSHGPYTFYKAVRIGHSRVLRLGSFFLTKLWSDADLVSIGELQLLWIDSRGPNTPLASLRLYFLPENTPDGRRDTHGEDEVLTISEKVVVRVHDLVTWLSPSLEWSWGREVSYPPTPLSSPDSSPQPQGLSDPGLDFTDVERHQKDLDALTTRRSESQANSCSQTKVVVLSYPRYCRYRSLLRRLEGSEPQWLCSSIAAALGGFTAIPGTRVLFCRDTFDYPDLETHELLCNHLAPKLKGRPRRKRKKRSVSPCGESSNESEASVASSAAASTSKGSSGSASASSSSSSSLARRNATSINADRKPSAEEKKFVNDVYSFMTSRNTPLGKMPLLGYRQIDLFLFYTKVQDLGGYDRVSANRLWKSIYDEMGGNTGSTSAATITRRHYERLLLPYERCQKGEESKPIKPTLLGRRAKTPSISDASEDSVEVKREVESPSPSVTPPPSTEASNSTVTPPPLQSILSSPFLPGDKPRSESGKTSSLRSVRVKPERLKSLNTIIATSNPAVPANNQQQLPNSPTSLLITTTTTATTTVATSNSMTISSSTTSSPTSTSPATNTPMNATQHSVLERQLNSPLITQQVPPTCSPSSLPVSTVTTNATTVVTLTPPPEKDMKEIKLDPKQTSLLAQGKENIPLFEEKSSIFVEKPRSPEVIDLETESESGTRDKLIIPSFKKRKLEILREGGLEVTPVDLDARPSVIQPTTTTIAGASQSSLTTTTNSLSAMAPSSSPMITSTFGVNQVAPASTPKQDDKIPAFALPPTTVIPKLINVTVTPDIGHMLPRSDDNQIRQHPTTPVKQQQSTNHSNSSPSANQISPPVNSRVINLGNSNNASLLQLYANANVPIPASLSNAAQSNHRFVPPSVVPNGRAMSHKVTQSRSIFERNEGITYGNPKDDINNMATPKYMPHMLPQPHAPRNPSVLPAPTIRGSSSDPPPGGVLDLTQKASPAPDRSNYGRPNLEIVRVPVVPRPTPLNLESRPQNLEAHHRGIMAAPTNLGKDMNHKQSPLESVPSVRKTQFITGSVGASPAGGYANVLDSRTMASNNLEITLVSPKKSSGGIVAVPQSSPPRNNTVQSPMPPMQRRHQPPPPSLPQQQHHLNGKFPSRLPPEPVSPYTPRKPITSSSSSSSSINHHPVIPNVPNLSHLNPSVAPSYSKPSHMSSYQHLAMEKRKAVAEEIARGKEQQRRISEGDKLTLQQHQQQQRLEGSSSKQQSREAESRRHSLPSLPSGFIPGIPPTNPAFLAHQLAAANNGSAPSAAAAAAAAAAGGKFLPMLDPYYSAAFYNGLFPGPMAPGAPAGPFLHPELSAYYKELLASSTAAQQTRLAMAAGQQHQPAAPTSK